MTNTNVDMLLVNLPWADLQVPYCAPAVLKGIAESAGFKIQTHDFNIDFKFQFCKNDQERFEEWMAWRNLISKEFKAFCKEVFFIISPKFVDFSYS